MPVSDEREPGIWEVLESLLGEPTFKCPRCGNEDASINIVCACSWKLQGCLPCAVNDQMSSGKERDMIWKEIEQHARECNTIRSLIRISRDRDGT